MSRIILLSLLLSIGISSLSFGQRNHRHKLAWSAERPLTWNDFKVRSSGGGGMKAMTDSGIAIWFDCNDEIEPIVVKCFFDKSKSWTKAEDSEHLLRHEQLHFDITELFTRKLRKKLAELEDPCGRNSGKVQGIYDRNFDEMNRYQKRYDKETKHSINESAQKIWEERVKRELEEFEAFASK